MGVPYPNVPVTKGGLIGLPFFYPSQATQSSIALEAISPRSTDSVLI